jgi:hypothetical protein
MKIDAGSSPFFVVTTVVFVDHDMAQACDNRIGALRAELKLSPYKEFHFSKDNDAIRCAFLNAVGEYDFSYSALILNKRALTNPAFGSKDVVYKYTVGLAFRNIRRSLSEAVVVVDRCGGREFVRELKTYVRKKMTKQEKVSKGNPQAPRRIKDMRSSKSHTNNLLQLCDMVCGAVARSYSDRNDRERYRRMIRGNERMVKMWPMEAQK